jgi:hypothetical protein
MRTNGSAEPLGTIALVAGALLALACGGGNKQAEKAGAARPGAAAGGTTLGATGEAVVADVAKRLAQFASTPITADLSTLGAGDREVLASLVAASREIEEVFWRQAWQGNPAMREQLGTLQGPDAEAARAYFQVNKGPWDRLEHFEPFIGTRPHPAGAGFYPEDLTKADFEAYLAANPSERDALLGLNTVVRRDATGQKLVAVPYSQEYGQWLTAAAGHLRAAAAKTSDRALKRFLTTRADAFLSNDYYESDLAWMDLSADAPIEVTIGPYETYEDGLMGAKASFEAYVTMSVPAESKALALYKERLPWLERNLPIPDQHKNLKRGTDSPIRVVDVVFAGGDANRGVQTIAFNLPNDERVREAKGSKKVLLRNVIRAKYGQILQPIARLVMVPEERAQVSYDAFFNHTLHHELAHGLGPGTITKNGQRTEVRRELQELYTPLEEAKADVMGAYNILALIERGDMPAEMRDSVEPTYIAHLIRAARFGAHEAHGRGTVSQFNYLLKKGAIEIDSQGRFRPIKDKFPGAIQELLAEMLMLQANGDYAGTKTFLETYGVPGPELDKAIAQLVEVPTDIRPAYSQAEGLTAGAP